MNIEIAQKIKTMLVESLRIPEDQLEFDSQLFGEDIGLDSIDSIEIIAGIDELFGIDMTGAPRENFQTIESLTAFVEANKGA
ncbi:MAG: acyl carrier protein [Ruminococcus sp.]|nr:phosphopantetheine-binding protein [uncultured Ruminococcus sp.]MBQ1350292.1 acyl carrier protein [Ruminococcus sp.]MBQ4261530.1 acyl carrier protein [Ruminococcus sp.]SCX19874.1 acyl carrier protein [Ruminococcaceae bacterium P7]